jgi:hypothetical protein
MASLTVEELADLLDPPMTPTQIRALISVIRLKPCGRRITGNRGRPVSEYDAGIVMAAHADMIRHVQKS